MKEEIYTWNVSLHNPMLGRRKWWFQIAVFDTHESMHRTIDECFPNLEHLDGLSTKAYDASFIESCDGKQCINGRMRWKVGLLCFHQDSLGAGVVSHECTHAAVALFDKACLPAPSAYRTHLDRRGMKLEWDREETFCECVGELVKAVYNHLYDNPKEHGIRGPWNPRRKRA